jgi:hypothetical protein
MEKIPAVLPSAPLVPNGPRPWQRLERPDNLEGLRANITTTAVDFAKPGHPPITYGTPSRFGSLLGTELSRNGSSDASFGYCNCSTGIETVILYGLFAHGATWPASVETTRQGASLP